MTPYDKIIPVRITVEVNDDPKVTHVVNFRCKFDPYTIGAIDFNSSPEWMLRSVTLAQLSKAAEILMWDDINSNEPSPYHDYATLSTAQAVNSILKQAFPTLT